MLKRIVVLGLLAGVARAEVDEWDVWAIRQQQEKMATIEEARLKLDVRGRQERAQHLATAALDLLQAGHHKEAAQKASEALQLWRVGLGVAVRGAAQLRLGLYRAALLDLEMAYNLKPHSIRTRAELAVCCKAVGDIERARFLVDTTERLSVAEQRNLDWAKAIVDGRAPLPAKAD